MPNDSHCRTHTKNHKTAGLNLPFPRFYDMLLQVADEYHPFLNDVSHAVLNNHPSSDDDDSVATLAIRLEELIDRHKQGNLSAEQLENMLYNLAKWFQLHQPHVHQLTQNLWGEVVDSMTLDPGFRNNGYSTILKRFPEGSLLYKNANWGHDDEAIADVHAPSLFT